MSQPGTYYNSPRTTPVSPPAKPIHWTPIIIVAVAAGTIISVADIIRKPVSRPAPVQDAAILAAPAPTRPIPEPVATPHSTPLPVPDPTPEPVVPRAQEVERLVRRADLAPGQFFAVQMPDGSTPLIRFMGKVSNIDHLPKNPNLFEMWQVTSTGHSWVYLEQFGRGVWLDP